MSGQMNLLAQPSEEAIEVPICAEVLHSGSRASNRATRTPLFPHRHIPHRPSNLTSDADWMILLDYAEGVHRYDQSAQARFQVDAEVSRSPGGRFGPRSPDLWHDGQGIKVNDLLVRWPRLLSARSEQREIEPEVARARDLAQAYEYLDYFGRVYEERPHREDWSPVPLIRRLAEEAIELGGDPTLLQLHTDYMREGIAEAARPRS